MHPTILGSWSTGLNAVIRIPIPEPTLGQMISALAILVAVAIAIGNALWQSKLQSRQLKQAMFEKRFTVYLAVRRFLGEITKTLQVELADASTLMRETNQAEFLFKPEIPAFIEDEIYKKAIRLRELDGMLLRDPRNERSQQWIEERAALEEWFAVKSHEIAKEKFGPYLVLYD